MSTFEQLSTLKVHPLLSWVFILSTYNPPPPDQPLSLTVNALGGTHIWDTLAPLP